MTAATPTKLLALGVVSAVLAGVAYSIFEHEESKIDPQWSLVSESDDSSKWYVNDSSFTYQEGRYTQGWIMVSNPKKDRYGTRSTKILAVFDCQDRRYRFMQTSSTDGPNGRGAVTGMLDASTTHGIPPGTNISSVADYVCQPLHNRTDDRHESQT
jgi:hypothetical protein